MTARVLTQPLVSWVFHRRWKLGVALLTAAGLAWKRRRRPLNEKISVEPVSEAWLAQHELEAGKSQSS